MTKGTICGQRTTLIPLAGRTKSKKEIEGESLEALKEGMGASLFEREKLDEVGGPSKAMNVMAKTRTDSGEATRDHFKHRKCRCAFNKG